MTYDVVVERVQPQLIAAVRAHVPLAGIAQAWKPALDQVWAFLKDNPDLPRAHNLFLYHHPARRDDPMEIDFGVQVARHFKHSGNVRCVETPAGEVARTLHVGPIDGLKAAHDAVHAWCAANGRNMADASWETYGDWTEDFAKFEVTIRYLLA
jgi:effector-binding domain-containing protein